MNGEPLPSKHGFPLRLINPGHYGQKMPKWITRIELIDEEYLGLLGKQAREQVHQVVGPGRSDREFAD